MGCHLQARRGMETTVGRAEGCTPESEVPAGSAPGRRCGLRSGAAAKGSRFRARKKGHRVVEALAFEDSGASCDDFVTESLSQSSRSSDALGNAPAHRVQMGTKAGALRMAPLGGRGRNRASSPASPPRRGLGIFSLTPLQALSHTSNSEHRTHAAKLIKTRCLKTNAFLNE